MLASSTCRGRAAIHPTDVLLAGLHSAAYVGKPHWPCYTGPPAGIRSCDGRQHLNLGLTVRFKAFFFELAG